MTKVRQAQLKGKKLLSRLTGISTPIGGVSWTPPNNESEIARKLLVFIEDRGVLFMPHDMEIELYVLRSVEAIRTRLTEDLEQVERTSTLGESIAAMRSSCRKFMTQVQDDRVSMRRLHMDGLIWQAIGELRAIFGLHIARIACAYDLELEDQLIPILPAEHEEQSSDSRHSSDHKKKRTSTDE